MKLARTSQFDAALDLMQNGGPFTFITGRAGTGKSTLLKHFRETTKLRAPVLAPTGVAALNVEGETIHRFFRFAPGITVKDARRNGGFARDPEVYKKADLLIIDEISMVRADLLDCMDQFLRVVRKNKRPFGGLRIVVIGDLFQLPPVVSSTEIEAFSEMYDSPYFFSSEVAKELFNAGKMDFIELEKVYRQSDKAFIGLLNAVRNRSVTQEELTKLNVRVQSSLPPGVIILTAVNAAADEVNERHLKSLTGPTKIFKGDLRGEFSERETPAEPELRLKKGARVMCVANDQEGRFVNGSLGWVMGFKEKEGECDVSVKLDDGKTISLSPHTWNLYQSIYDKKTKTLDQHRLGSYKQIPLKLAWAVTIHKSQGKTFDQVTIDLGRGAFATGQTYVALSRCRSFEGITLAKPVKLQDIRLDPAITEFVASLQE